MVAPIYTAFRSFPTCSSTLRCGIRALSGTSQQLRREQVPPASAIYLGVHRELPFRYAQFGATYTLMTEPIKPSLQNGFVVAKV